MSRRTVQRFEVQQVANGFIVSPGHDYRSGNAINFEEMRIFRTEEEVAAFIKDQCK